MKPSTLSSITCHPMPVTEYEKATAGINRLIEEDRASGMVNSVCVTRLHTGGHPTQRAILFLHGFTSCPQIWATLADSFITRGYNVFIPRLPYHGMQDRFTRDLRRLTAADLFSFTDRCVDLARGLGNHLTVVGLSLGASLVAWLAQHRADIDLAVPISPMFRPAFLSAGGGGLFLAASRVLPNFYVWWDPRTKAKNPMVNAYSYYGFPARSFAETVRVGVIAERQALKGKPAAKRILMVSNGADVAVSLRSIHRVVQAWRRDDPEKVQAYEFDRQYNLLHDLISPEHPGSRIDIVYPKLIELIEQAQ